MGADTAFPVGDFIACDPTGQPMRRGKKDGAFTLSLELPRNRTFEFRYWLDGSRWENDWAADEYRPTAFGCDNSVVHT